MNKTILLACCDFLILATLAMMQFNKSPESTTTESLEISSDFALGSDEATSETSTSEAIFLELKIQKLQSALIQKAREQGRQEIKLQSVITANNNLMSQIQKLKLGTQTSIHQAVAKARWQINISMREDDAVSPDNFSRRLFTCVLKIGEKFYLPADFNKLGLNWDELINDGHIDTLTVTVGRTGVNPWSSYVKAGFFSMHQDPSCCFIEILPSRVKSAIGIVKRQDIHKDLNRLFAAKSDGRLIKINNAAILPDSPQWLDINEERFLGHPDKVEKGDLIVTESGLAVGIVTAARSTANRQRLKAFIMDYFTFADFAKIPLEKKKTENYYVDFVQSVRDIQQRIK